MAAAKGKTGGEGKAERGVEDKMKEKEKKEEIQAYQEAFDAFDWNNSGTIPFGDLQYCMRRAGQNPTDVEVHDMINKIFNASGTLNFEDFCKLMAEKYLEDDPESNYKDAFKVFGKDDEGCIHPDELKFVMRHLPGKVTNTELDEMINIIDKNGDGKISYSEFRCMMGAMPILMD